MAGPVLRLAAEAGAEDLRPVCQNQQGNIIGTDGGEELGGSVDLDAVFVVGHSLGASFANSLAWARGGQVRAVGSVAGGIDGSACTGRAAALLLYNPADRAVPIGEGLGARDALLGDAEAVPRPSTRHLGEFACDVYPAASGPVLWCPYHDSLTRTGRYYPHQWPAGAGPAIIRFFMDW